MDSLRSNECDGDDEVLLVEISDAALERAVWDHSGANRALTVAMCSGLDSCPA